MSTTISAISATTAANFTGNTRRWPLCADPDGALQAAHVT